jgi:hypothetical protein
MLSHDFKPRKSNISFTSISTWYVIIITI